MKKAVAKKAIPKKAPTVAKTLKVSATLAAPSTQAKPHLAELPTTVKQFIAAANPPFDKTAVTPTGALGQTIDAKLLKAATEMLGRKPMPSERAELRRLFRENISR